MRSLLPAARRDRSTRPSLGSQIELLIGDKRRMVGTLASISLLSGFTEGVMIATVAQVATKLVNGKGGQRSGILHIGASVSTLLWIALGLAIFRLLLQWPMSILPAKIAADVQLQLRTRVFRAFGAASWDVQSRDREGQLQEVMTSQTSQATAGALQATTLVSASLIFLILLGFAIALSPPAAALIFTVAVALFALMRPLRMLGGRRSAELSRAQIRYAGAIAEANRLAEESQVFGVTDAQYERMLKFIRRCRDLFFRTQLIAKAVPNIYQSLIFVVLVLGLITLNTIGTHHAGRLLAIVLLLLRAAQAGQSIQGAYQALQQSIPFIDRLRRAEARYAASQPVEGTTPLPEISTLAFDEVSFSYTPGRPVLNEVSFSVEAGEAIGIVGPSGAGKSTLVQILLHLREPGQGRYLIDGTDVREFSREDWHRLIAYVPQEPRLLHATVSENIRFFRDVDEEAVERAARLARIHDDVMSWGKGYETIVGPRADAVSGGQQQRICLARALVARPQVLVLDEPTSALDPHSETLIQQSLSALKSELTLFTIAHRMSTLDMCDRVMVILDGRLTAFDTKEALQEHNHYYRTASLIAASAAGGALP
ncbi:MAG TPA: ABC transporter ATP-binding protein [Solirubrobacteraceae bacterium]|nr:ABC transporter ATP-binding protein [Solirubrobacteraceae bacterium]